MRPLRGMSLIDVLVGIAIMLVIFTGLTALLVTSLKVSTLAKNRSIATTVAESQMEYIRSLSYDNVGTVGGIPAGTIPQFATSTQNGLTVVTRTLIEYKDDPADGLGSLDTNGINNDYKQIKISATYQIDATVHTLNIISNFAPIGIETTTGGGTLKISVVNAVGGGVSGATVHIVNASSSPTVDFTTFSDSAGIVYLPGALASSEYQVYVSKFGYSSTQTYARDAVNQNPAPGYLTVAVNLTTTGTFAIDHSSTLNIATFFPIATSSYSDSFGNSNGIASTTNTVVSGGKVILDGGPLAYAPSGNVTSIAVAPLYLNAWTSASITSETDSGKSVLFHVLDSSTGTLVPDVLLAGNAAGFDTAVDLSTLSTTSYPSLMLSADLTTGSLVETPALKDWKIQYLRGPIPFPNIPFMLTGGKIIGSTGSLVPIVKTTVSTSTNSSAVSALPLEWDSYALTISGYDIVSACNAPPYVLAPSASLNSLLSLGSSTPHSLLITTNDVVGAVPGAAVTLSRSGYNKTVVSDSCGSAYFGSISTASDYSVTATKAGYTTYSASNVSVTTHDYHEALLAP